VRAPDRPARDAGDRGRPRVACIRHGLAGRHGARRARVRPPAAGGDSGLGRAGQVPIPHGAERRVGGDRSGGVDERLLPRKPVAGLRGNRRPGPALAGAAPRGGPANAAARHVGQRPGVQAARQLRQRLPPDRRGLPAALLRQRSPPRPPDTPELDVRARWTGGEVRARVRSDEAGTIRAALLAGRGTARRLELDDARSAVLGRSRARLVEPGTAGLRIDPRRGGGAHVRGTRLCVVLTPAEGDAPATAVPVRLRGGPRR
jgi:hypothetical protein